MTPRSKRLRAAKLLAPVLMVLGLVAACQRPPVLPADGDAARMAADAKRAVEDLLVEIGILQADLNIFPACNDAQARAIRVQPPFGSSCEDFAIELRVVAAACVAQTGVVDLFDAARAEMVEACSQFCTTERNCPIARINIGNSCARTGSLASSRCPQGDCGILEYCALVGSLNGPNCFCRDPV